MENWVEVTEEQAKGHPLYGGKGWSLILIILLVVFGLGIAGNFTSDFVLLFRRPDVGIGLVLVILIGNGFSILTLINKNSNFQKIVTACLVAEVLIFYFVMESFIDIQASQDYFTRRLGAPLLFYSGIIWCAWASTRINVTCAHRIKVNDPYFDAISESTDVKSPKIISSKSDSAPNPTSPEKAEVSDSKNSKTTSSDQVPDPKQIEEMPNTSPPLTDESSQTRNSHVKGEEDPADNTVSVQVKEPEREDNEPTDASASDSIKERLETVKNFKEQGLIDEEQAKKKQEEILREL